MGLDQALGLSFRHHVIAGYEFIMRYYSPGDCIYIFGFSRGAYTARFLAEMLQKIGLLSRGNDEMVSFAWKTFSDWQASRSMTRAQQSKKNEKDEEYMTAFKNTFCRDEVHVHFLGLFDCVNSVGQFDLPFRSSSFQQIPTKVADNVRHAVAINERRIKFKPALFHQDGHELNGGNFKEVWFAGAHGDIGGGWPLVKDETRTLSNLPLKWMLDEIRDLPETDHKLKFKPDMDRCLDRKVNVSSKDIDEFILKEDIENTDPIFPKPHDELKFRRAKSGYMSMVATAFWRLIEYIPLFSRLEYEEEKWVVRRFPPSCGAYRDIPAGADIHSSVKLLFEQGVLPKDETPAAILAEAEGSKSAEDQPFLSARAKRNTQEAVKPK
ncbi:MAG: hypothetical protein LQ341_000764 [Variospora aurantia]|nr:MAG: hypothetical protein LQ341_000764 [Variospora aurantia]